MRVAIIGGGIAGLSTAYYLAKSRFGEVYVFEKGIIGYGSSTRNGARFRVHFWSEENSLFARESKKLLINFAKETGWNSLFDVSGYLWLIHNEQVLKEFRDKNRMWSKIGVGGKILDIDELKKMFPYVKADNYVGAFYGPQDGKIHHDHIIYGYLHASKKLGAKIFTNTEVRKILVKNGEVVGLEIDGKVKKFDYVVVAAGVYSKKLLEGCGVEIPIEAQRKEIGVTDPVKYFINPLIIDSKTGAYFGQTLRGEVIGSIPKPKISGLVPLENTIVWLSSWAKAISKIVPVLKSLKILRIWSGFYAVTPDHSHILGRGEDWPDGLYVNTGYSGHGFMMAPLGGKLLAKYIATGEIHKLMKPFTPNRFKRREYIKEIMVIG